MSEELIGIGRVRAAENDGSGGHCGGCFTSEIRPGITWVNLVCPPVSGHILWSLPTVVVSVAIANLIKKTTKIVNRNSIKLIICGVSCLICVFVNLLCSNGV